MRCGFCERLKKIRKVDILVMLCICLFMYIANQFQLREYRAKKAEDKSVSEQKQDAELKKYEDLQRQCYFKQNENACELLKQY